MNKVREYYAISAYQDLYVENKIKEVKQLKWNTDAIYWAAFDLGFRLVRHNDLHYSLYQSKKKRFDYWPSDGTGLWYYKNQSSGKPSKIPDIEAYLIKHFKSIQ